MLLWLACYKKHLKPVEAGLLDLPAWLGWSVRWFLGGFLTFFSRSDWETTRSVFLNKLNIRVIILKAAVRNFLGLKIIQNQYLSKYITSQCSKLSPQPIHNGQLIIMFSNLSGTGRFSWEIRACVCVITLCKHKEVVPASRLSHVRILQVTDRLLPFLTTARISKCIILMADCDPERIMCL